MRQFDTVIRNCTVATATDTFDSDIGISAGKISALGQDLAEGIEEIDAGGLLVLPGGIDSHCHFDQQRKTGPGFSDDFESATTSAAFGGNTSVISFTPQFKGEGIKAFVEDCHRKAKRSLIDYGFHVCIADPSPSVMKDELPQIIADGHKSIKIFMTYEPSYLSDEQILDVLAAAKKHGALVVVHAENNGIIRWLTSKLLAEGKTSSQFHAVAKPSIVESEAVNRMVVLSEVVGQPVQIFHVTSEGVVDVIQSAQGRGLEVYAETCPQYLAFTAKELERAGMAGAQFICSPALREDSDREALWRAIRNGVIGVVSSDHAPFNAGDPDAKGIIENGGTFAQVPNGMPGIETRLPYLFSEGVGKGRITLQQFVAITSTNAAKLFGLYPHKGSIAIGMDADLAIWDPSLSKTVRYKDLHDRSGYTPFEGMTFMGWPVRTLVRGRTVVADGNCVGTPGFGQFMKREPFEARKQTAID